MKTLLGFALLAMVNFGLHAEDRVRLEELEEVIAKKLASTNQKEFHEMFYFSSSREHEENIHEEIRELFARHFKSGIGVVQVWPLKDQDFHREIMGEMKADGLHRAPGPPFAYLEVYPSDKNDPDYMGLNFRLAKIEGDTRIVFHQLEPGVPQFLSGKVSTWERADGSQFEARLVREVEGDVHFRTPAAEPLVLKLSELSESDQQRVSTLASKANGAAHRTGDRPSDGL